MDFAPVAFVGGANGTYALFGGDFVVGAYRNSFEVGVNSEVIAVADNDCFAGAWYGDNSADSSFKYRTRRSSFARLYIDAVVFYDDALEFFVGMFAEGSGDGALLYRPG